MLERNTSDVLLVDDDPALRRLLSKWLTTAGYDVRCASDGREAVEMIKERCPDLLLTDWDMPNINGVELCQWIRKQTLPHYVYTLFLTVRSSNRDIIEGLESGADDFIKKPVDKGELLARLHAGKRVLGLEQQLRELARSDSLTGLATQRTLYDHLKESWESDDSAASADLSCVMLDLDYFKSINDNHGHQVGDTVLKKVAAVLKQATQGQFTCRYGGEEFCIILTGHDEEQAAAWAHRARLAVAAEEFHCDNGSFNVTASVGVATRLEETEGPADLVDRADQALLVAKRSGRNRVVRYQDIAEQSVVGDANSASAQFANLDASKIMTPILSAVPRDATLSEAGRYFLELRIPSAPVIDETRQVVGLITEQDVMNTMLTPNWGDIPVEEIMRDNAVCFDAATPATTVLEFLCRVATNSVIIVRDGQPIGIINRSNLVRWFVDAYELVQQTSPSLSLEDLHSSDQQRARIMEFANLVVEEAQQLESRASDVGAHDLLGSVLCAVSRIEELGSRMLADSNSCSQEQQSMDGDNTVHGISQLISEMGPTHDLARG